MHSETPGTDDVTYPALTRYRARIRRVLIHIHRHLDEDLDLARLSNVAAFSPFHFHRQFIAITGISAFRYVHLTRLKRASYRLAFRPWETVTDIALQAGYEAPDAFTRAFKQIFGQTPSAFREAPGWTAWHAAFAPAALARALTLPSFDEHAVRTVTTQDIAVARLEHRGTPAGLGGTIRRFIAWRRQTGFRPPYSATFTVFDTDQDCQPAGDYHIGLAAGTGGRPLPQPVSEEAGISGAIIPGGRCAVLRITGSSDDLRPAALYLYGRWLPGSGETLRDFPLYAQRLRFFPDVPEHEAVTELYLPLR